MYDQSIKIWKINKGPRYGLLIADITPPDDGGTIIESTVDNASLLAQVWEISLLMSAIQSLFLEAGQAKNLNNFLSANCSKFLHGANSRIQACRKHRRDKGLLMLPFNKQDHLYFKSLILENDLQTRFMAEAVEAIKPENNGSVSISKFSAAATNLIPAQAKDWS